MHKQVIRYIEKVKAELPSYFVNVDVLDCGSLDINGNNRRFFENSNYFGIDIVQGKNVDHVTRVHEFNPGKQFDVVISTEMLEHDEFWDLSINRMFELLKPGGLLLITAAGFGRPEHGTTEHHPNDSPMTHNYYRNIHPSMLSLGLDFTQFCSYSISYVKYDIRFAGIKTL